jgi:hypothetical protein
MTIAEDMTFNTEVVYALPAERICYIDAPLYLPLSQSHICQQSYHPNITQTTSTF